MKTPADIAQPHDRFLKELLSHPLNAGTLLREHLPEEVVRFLSDEAPELVKGSFVDEQLREHLSDRLFKVKTVNDRTAFLYVLIEHKSAPDRRIGLQLLRYMAEILRQWEKENPKWERLPAIVPFVFYHGAEEWKIPNEFLHLVDFEDAWKPYLLNFRFPVLDLGNIPDPQLSKDRRLYVRLLAMKYATRGKQQMAIKDLLIDALRDDPQELRPIIHYLVYAYHGYDEQTLREIIRKVRPEEEQPMMSQFAQDIRKAALQEGVQQGVQQGHQEGLLQGEAKLLLRQLSRRFQPLPDEISRRVYTASPNAIEIWADRVLDAKSLDEVFLE
ncbi:MAG: Rpn family recombination-promoting nuclease/putative transposase [Gammaproteobacteria bacterium]|nr:Rpn family recombination-promoting nuclease/putative transposase [Gammaproteobacteria bacterium]NNJ83886.1 Rpn family recombination-promoting nuclease/putative transposase [Gammaproteobacteria bacterium]